MNMILKRVKSKSKYNYYVWFNNISNGQQGIISRTQDDSEYVRRGADDTLRPLPDYFEKRVKQERKDLT